MLTPTTIDRWRLITKTYPQGKPSMKSAARALGGALLALIAASPTLAQNPPGPITVFVAKKIVTMDPTLPTATAVAVRDGQILSVGSLQDLAPWLKDNRHTIDE
jgi:hypothetical protein